MAPTSVMRRVVGSSTLSSTTFKRIGGLSSTTGGVLSRTIVPFVHPPGCECCKPIDLIGGFVARSFSGTTAANLKPATPIPDSDGRRKGLAWRAKQRGWLELDWLVGTFAQHHLANMNDDQLIDFEKLLDLDNPDLFKWVSNQSPPPESVAANPVYQMLAAYVSQEHPDIMKKMSTQNQNLE